MEKDIKKALYENIMSSVAKEVKKALNESDELADKQARLKDLKREQDHLPGHPGQPGAGDQLLLHHRLL